MSSLVYNFELVDRIIVEQSAELGYNIYDNSS